MMYRLLLLLMSICMYAGESRAQKWTRVADWELTRRMCPIAFTWNGKGYVGFGHDYNAAACFKDIGYYDPAANRWGEEAYLPLNGRTAAFCFCYKDLLYFGGGTRDSGKTPLTDFYCYHLNKRSGEDNNIPSYDRTCDTLPTLPFNKAFGAKAVLIDSIAYVAGGCAVDKCEQYLWAYNIEEAKWTRLCALPFEGEFGYVFALGGKVYYGGGNDHTGVTTSQFWVYNPAPNTWTQLGSLPGDGRTMGISIAINDHEAIAGLGFNYNSYHSRQIEVARYPIYRLFGEDAYEPYYLLNDLWKYDAINDRWHRFKRFPDSRRNACAFIADGALYISMGNTLLGITKSTYKINLY